MFFIILHHYEAIAGSKFHFWYFLKTYFSKAVEFDQILKMRSLLF